MDKNEERLNEDFFGEYSSEVRELYQGLYEDLLKEIKRENPKEYGKEGSVAAVTIGHLEDPEGFLSSLAEDKGSEQELNLLIEEANSKLNKGSPHDIVDYYLSPSNNLLVQEIFMSVYKKWIEENKGFSLVDVVYKDGKGSKEYKLYKKDAILYDLISRIIKKESGDYEKLINLIRSLLDFLIVESYHYFDLNVLKNGLNSKGHLSLLAKDVLDSSIEYRNLLKNPISTIISSVVGAFIEQMGHSVDLQRITYGRFYSLYGVAEGSRRDKKEKDMYRYIWADRWSGNKRGDYHTTKNPFFAKYHFMFVDDYWDHSDIFGNPRQDDRAIIIDLRDKLGREFQLSVVFPRLTDDRKPIYANIDEYLEYVMVTIKEKGRGVKSYNLKDYFERNRTGKGDFDVVAEIIKNSNLYYEYSIGEHIKDIMLDLIELKKYKEVKDKAEGNFNELIYKITPNVTDIFNEISPVIFFRAGAGKIIGVDNMLEEKKKEIGALSGKLKKSLLGKNIRKMTNLEKSIRNALKSLSFYKSSDPRPSLAAVSIKRRFYASPFLLSSFPTLHPLHREAHRVDDSGGEFDVTLAKGVNIPEALREHLYECHGKNYFPHFHTDDEELLKKEFYVKSSFTDEWEINTFHLNLHREDHYRYINNITDQAPDYNVIIKGELIDPYLAEHIKMVHGRNYIHHPLPMPNIKEDTGFVKAVLEEELSKFFTPLEISVILENDEFIKSVRGLSENEDFYKGPEIAPLIGAVESAAPRIAQRLSAGAPKVANVASKILSSLPKGVSSAVRYGAESVFSPKDLGQEVVGSAIKNIASRSAERRLGPEGGELVSSAVNLGKEFTSGNVTPEGIKNLTSSLKKILSSKQEVSQGLTKEQSLSFVEKASNGDNYVGSVVIGVAEDGEEVYGELCADIEDIEDSADGLVVKSGYVRFNDREYPVSGLLILDRERGVYYPEDLIGFFGGVPIIEGESYNSKLKVIRT